MKNASSDADGKNPAAVALGQLRAAQITPEERKKWSKLGVKARQKKIPPAQRKEIAKKAAAARWAKKKAGK